MVSSASLLAAEGTVVADEKGAEWGDHDGVARQERVDVDILVYVRPAQSLALVDDPHVAALGRGRRDESRKPAHRHADFTFVLEDDADLP